MPQLLSPLLSFIRVQGGETTPNADTPDVYVHAGDARGGGHGRKMDREWRLLRIDHARECDYRLDRVR